MTLPLCLQFQHVAACETHPHLPLSERSIRSYAAFRMCEPWQWLAWVAAGGLVRARWSAAQRVGCLEPVGDLAHRIRRLAI